MKKNSVMTEERYITIEQAQVLANKQFDGFCHAFYHVDGHDFPKATQAMVLDWMLENMNIFVYADPYWYPCDDGMMWQAKIATISSHGLKIEKVISTCHSREEACSKAIDHVLNEMI